MVYLNFELLVMLLDWMFGVYIVNSNLWVFIVGFRYDVLLIDYFRFK